MTSCFHDRTPMESISTTSSLRIRRKNSAKSSTFQQRISSVRHGEQLAGSGGMSLQAAFRAFFISTADPSPHQTSAQAVAESADERPDQTEAGNHPQECHLGRCGGFLGVFASIKKTKNAFALSCFYCVSRPGGGSVQQHGGRFHETCGGGGRPAAERRSQRHCLQRAAGSHRGHHGCAPLSARAPLLLMSGAFYANAYKSESVQVRSCG